MHAAACPRLRVNAAAVAVVAATWAALPADEHAQRYAAPCAACHGADGRSTQPLIPHLGGQPAFYAITQLFLFREGRRNDHPMAAAMAAAAQGMSENDLRGFSAFIATLPAPPVPAPTDAVRAARGKALAARHHCNACHGADLAGGAQVPRLAGQQEAYLRIALKGFRSGVRPGYTQAMGEALAGLSDQDLDDLAHHLAHPTP